MGFIGGRKSRPPSESKRQPSGLRLEASIWKNGLASPKGDLQICSEVGNSRGRVQAPDCPLPALQRYSLIIALLSMKEQASGICGEGFEFGFLQTAKAYSNENSLSGKGEACTDSQAVF